MALMQAAISARRYEDAARFARQNVAQLPAFVKAELDRNVAVIVADNGNDASRYDAGGDRLYGLYTGWTAARPTDGAKIVLCQPGTTATAKSQDTMLWTTETGSMCCTWCATATTNRR